VSPSSPLRTERQSVSKTLFFQVLRSSGNAQCPGTQSFGAEFFCVLSVTYPVHYFIENCRLVKFEPIFAIKQFISPFVVVIPNFSSSCALPAFPSTASKISQEQDAAAGNIRILQCSHQCTPPMNSSPHSPSRRSKGACVDTGPTTCLPDSSNLY
jgi:hypothetical protein